jgi:hypothetical protein
MGAALSTLLYAALRIARVTGRAGRGPSLDQFLEAMAIFNRMVDGWSAVRVNIFQLLIAQYTLTANQQTYTIGPGGTGPYWLGSQSASGAVRPEKLVRANLFITSDPTPVRRPIGILEPLDWANKRVQQISGPPLQIYDDYASPISTLYTWPIADQSYPVEFYTWNPIPQATALGNMIQLSAGYQEGIVYNLAKRIPGAQLSQQDLEIARRSLAVIQARNAQSPRLVNDAAGLSGRGRGNRADFNWATGEPWR